MSKTGVITSKAPGSTRVNALIGNAVRISDPVEVKGHVGEWKKTGGKWWFSFDDGSYARGWCQIDGDWYYFNGSGYMQTGWLKSGGTWYYLSSSGAMKTGWLKNGGAWYYLKGSGAMATGWQKVGDEWYHLASSGVMTTKRWVGDYYLEGSGTMATNKWIGKYYVGADGKWVRNAGSNSANNATVYWVKDGKVYHLSKDCASLKRSTNIQSGNISQSGKSQACKVCG